MKNILETIIGNPELLMIVIALIFYAKMVSIIAYFMIKQNRFLQRELNLKFRITKAN
ncbi:hypothetical protein [Tenacibaculum sp. 190524A02b]|uniref:hypothetical protein n=1 Tax=Tenacibaculum vairaonense TaxID=3137860 RepID=UPI0031FAB7A1